MRRFELARRRGRELRASFDIQLEGLQARLEQYLREEHKMTPRALSADAMRDSKAEVLPQKRELRYDKALNDHPVEKLFIFAHEVGHLELHQRHIGPHAIPNPLRDSRFATSDGAGAIARYSPKDAEEVEANAFAKEFVCPANLAFADWLQDPTATASSLAAKWGASEEIVQIQLAEALFDLFFKSDPAGTAPRTHEISLNEEQRLAAEYLGGAVVVDAGPGTGKTATLVMRVDFLLRQKIAPSQILVLTFSNEAADELRERVEERFGEEIANAIEIHTFHSFGHARLLSNTQNLAPTFRILDEIAQEELVTELLGKIECEAIITLRDPGETARLAVEQINFLKDRMYGEAELERAITELRATDAQESASLQKAEQFLALFREYERAKYDPVKREIDTIDFADMILLTLQTFRENKTLITEIRKQYKHVLVDEFQDVSPAMIQFLGQLCGEHNPPWVVGDIRQAIYRFRGADPDRNLALFKQHFPKAEPFDLRSNYRSCQLVIQAANQMATLMASPEHATGDYETFWKVGANHQPFGETPIQILSADSDAAEQEGIAELVNKWREAGAKAGEIAVLARRNIDVRNIVLALGRRKIKATTTGLLTPEGAAGDLAAALTLADAPTASLPRIIKALGMDCYEPELLNEVTGSLLAEEIKNEFESPKQNELLLTAGADLIAEYRQSFDCLHKQKHNSDAFALLCAFLFDGSGYLRRCLSDKDETRKRLMLSEIITTLTRAADYRFTHQKLKPRESRLGFAQNFRDNLSSSKPITAAPRSTDDAVRVMTCHASKGLEFPIVIVAGQTINKDKRKERDWWLPPELMPSGEEDRKQADSLLFVGLTRAQRAAVITYAEAKTSGGKKRDLPGLLGRWHSRYEIPLKELPGQENEKTVVKTNALWGRRPRANLPVRHLDKSICGLETYLEKFLGIRFPQSLPALYPGFTVAVRRAMRKIIVQAQLEQRQIVATEAREIFLAVYQDESGERQNHPHYQLYERVGASFSQKFAVAFKPHKGGVEFLHLSEDEELILDQGENLIPLRLDLVACFRDKQGVAHAILYRRESLSKNITDELNWSAINQGYKRVSFVVLRRLYPSIQFHAFSGADGRLYRIKPNRTVDNMDKEAALAMDNLHGFTNGRFTAQVEDFKCDGCPVRITCPHWLNALPNA